MKKLLLLSFCILFTLFAFSNPSDSTELTSDKTDHISFVPFYTPFVTMYKVKINKKEIWKIAFSMIISKSDSIYVEELNDNCRTGVKCEKALRFNTYSSNNTSGASGIKIEDWLFEHNAELRRENVTYDSKAYEICTFVINMRKSNGSRYGSGYKDASFKVVIGAHPKETKSIDLTHQGGAIHWPD